MIQYRTEMLDAGIPMQAASASMPMPSYAQMVLAYRLDAISQDPKSSRFPGPNPLPLALVMDQNASKNIKHGAYKS